MQIELTLNAPPDADYSARDLGFLLHKNPDHVHTRDTAHGAVTIFYPEVSDERTTTVLHLDVDPVGLVRGKNRESDGLLAKYVNEALCRELVPVGGDGAGAWSEPRGKVEGTSGARGPRSAA